MPDALSRRSDYHGGKGATVDQQYNFVQALPSISNIDNSALLPPRPTKVLRALQRIPEINREYFIDDNDLRNGLVKDPDLCKIVDELKSVCVFGDNKDNQYHGRELDSVGDLRRKSQNLAFILPAWTLRQFLAFNNRIYVPNINDSRLKIL
jgi:hypothetical protein